MFSWFVVPYSWIKCSRIKDQKLPPIKNKLLEIPAAELAPMIRTQQVSSEEVIAAYIDRCKEVNPLLNAIVSDRFEDALRQAREIDIFIRSKTKTVAEIERDTPLLGIPVTIKESIGVAGMQNQSGRKYKTKRIATADAPSVAQLRKSGVIILLVSNTPELCMQWETYNHVTGLTKNPYNLKTTCGGSSGGEAALIASAGSLFGLSSDVGGSVRLPAMYVGVFGHKPTPYLVSPLGHVPCSPAPNWGDFFTIAPMARYACDLPLLLKSIANAEIDQNQSILKKLDQNIEMNDIKVYFMDNDGPSGLTRPISSDIKSAFTNVANFLNAKEHSIGKMKHSFDISTAAMLRLEDLETIFNEKWEDEDNKSLNQELLKFFCGLSKFTFSSIFIGYLQLYAKNLPKSMLDKYDAITQGLKSEFRELLGDNGVFLYPSFPTVAHNHYKIFCKLVDTSYLMIFNTLGMPVTNVKIGVDKNRMPIGMQIVANPGNDHLTLRVATELESKFGGWTKP